MKRKLMTFVVLLFAAISLQSNLFAQGEDNPTGITGDHNGNVTTAGNYDPYTANAKRIVDDIVVTGSVGAYPLKWTWYWNSRYEGISPNGGWRFSHEYFLSAPQSTRLGFPDGRLINNHEFAALACKSGLAVGRTNREYRARPSFWLMVARFVS